MNRAFFSSIQAKFFTNSVNHRGWAWVWLCLALVVHVFDEAMTDFLSVYNPTVQAIRQRFPFFPMPVFTFEVWLTGLIAAIIILLLLSPFAFQQRGWIKLFSYPFAILMLLNGLGHIAGSFYLGRLAPAHGISLRRAKGLLRRLIRQNIWSRGGFTDSSETRCTSVSC